MSISRFEEEIIISAIDKRKYRHVTLANKLQCLLVCDPETEKSSACCDVRVGSLSDPKEAQGLAHFLEHMLFMGTDKYPVENAYSAFLNNHGGFSNAYTSEENTVYYFDIQNDHMEPALDMFASFFTCPLLSDSATSREMNAVDSENTKNLQNDSWRNFQLLKSLAREDHPLNAFSTGNLETLKTVPESQGLSTRDMVIAFYRKHYSANLMKVVVYSKESLDTMEAWVAEKFSAVPNQDLPRSVFPSDPYGSAQVQKYLEVVPIRDVKKLLIAFPLPAFEEKYLTKPVSYLGHLLGHESGGSILSALKARLWANGLSAGANLSNSDFACFAVTVELSDEGVNHIDEIVSCVFAYIGMLQREGAQEWVWKELQETAEMNFRFINKVEPSDYATSLANGMHVYSIPHTVCGSELKFQCDLSMIAEYVNQLVPSNCIVSVAHKGLAGKTFLKERWYGTEHNKTDFTPAQVSLWEASLQSGGAWGSQLALPLPNPFIPTDFELKTPPTPTEAPAVSHPVLVQRLGSTAAVLEVMTEQERTTDETTQPESNGEAVADTMEVEGEEEEEDEEEDEDELEPISTGAAVDVPLLPGDRLLTWHLQDQVWAVPKMNVKVSLEALQATSTPLNVTLTELFTMCLKENLNEYSYYADCAGLYYDVTLAKGGLDIVVQGYGHKLPVLVSKIVEEMQRFAVNPSACSADLFARMKEKSLRTLKNYLFWQPYYHCIVGSLLCLEDGRFSHAEKYRALETATLSDFSVFVSTLLQCLRAQVLVHGNTTVLETEQLTALITEKLPFRALPTAQIPVRRVVQLVPGVSYIYRQHSALNNPNEVNSAVENIYHVGLSDGARAGTVLPTLTSTAVVQEASLELLSHMMSEPAFDQLRTKEQLGYIVFTGIKRLNKQYLALHIIVQSSHKDADFLDTRVEDFLENYRQQLTELSDEDFQANTAAVIEKLVEKPKNIDEECDQYWTEVTSGMYWFQRKTTLAAALRSGVVTRASLLAFFDLYVAATSAQRCKFSSQFYGQNRRYIKPAATAGAAEVEVVTEPVQFRRAHALHPVPDFAPTAM